MTDSVYIGKTFEEAIEIADERGHFIRALTIDGKGFLEGQFIDLNRVNVDIEDGIIVKVHIRG